MLPRSARERVSGAGKNLGSRATRSRRSPLAKVVGDWAEQIAMRHVRQSIFGATKIRHVSVSGETPGWDIEYLDNLGDLNAVEVKGATGAIFPNFELTQGELDAARRLKNRYWLCLVANCLSTCPKLQLIQDPVALIERQLFSIEPLTWRVCLIEDA